MIKKSFSKEVQFQVGQRVHVELKQVPLKDRLTPEGEIISVNVRFPKSPELRKIYYTVRFDDDYLKKKSRMFSGIPVITCTGDKLTLLDK